MKYIITGHKGLIGSSLKNKLDNLKYKCVKSIDLRENENTKDLKNLKIKANIVFHLADNCKINKCIKNPNLSFENVNGIYSVLEMCRKNNIKKIVYFSSSRILGIEKNPYIAGKIYGEELIKAYNKCYGIEYIIIRPSAVYGGNDKTKRLIEIWLNNAIEEEDLEIYGNSSKTLSFTYITDFINNIIKCLNKDWNKEYNIAGKEEELLKVAKEIIKQTNSKSKIIFKHKEIEQPQKVNIKSDFECPTLIKDGIKFEIIRKIKLK